QVIAHLNNGGQNNSAGHTKGRLHLRRAKQIPTYRIDLLGHESFIMQSKVDGGGKDGQLSRKMALRSMLNTRTNGIKACAQRNDTPSTQSSGNKRQTNKHK
ncbi:uncharacterized, partial [Tachysurus ichikawai]